MTKNRAFILLVLIVWCKCIVAQQISIHGRILDESGHPLPFVTVRVADDFGTATAIDGTFQMVLPDDAYDSVHFSHIGYQPKSVSIAYFDNGHQVIRLDEGIQQLDEVIVSGGGREVTAEEIAWEAIRKYQISSNDESHIARVFCSDAVMAPLLSEPEMETISLGYGVYGGYEAKISYLAQFKYFYDNLIVRLPRGKGNPQITTTGCSSAYNFLRYEETKGVLDTTMSKDYSFSYLEMEGNLMQLAFKGPNGKGKLQIDGKNQIHKVYYDRYKEIWSQLHNRRVTGEAQLIFSYYNEIPYVDQIELTFAQVGKTYSLKLKTLLQKTARIQISDNELLSLNRQSVNPVVNLDLDEWNKWLQSFTPDQKDVEYTKQLISAQSEDNEEKLIGSKISELEQTLFSVSSKN